MYRLHGFCQSGNTFKVAFLLRALNQPWEPQFVDFMNGVTRTGEWRESTNEMGEVPVLDDGERRLTQSGVILSYLASKHGAFGGRTEDERLEVLRWLLFDNHKFTSTFASYRFMKAFGPAAPDPAVMSWLRGRLDNSFAVVDKHLAQRSFMIGADPTIADISLCLARTCARAAGLGRPLRHPARRAHRAALVGQQPHEHFQPAVVAVQVQGLGQRRVVCPT
jgi:glutathione S-transferase